MTAAVIRDDAQVIEVTARKAYAAIDEKAGYDVLPYAGTRIRLYPIEDP